MEKPSVLLAGCGDLGTQLGITLMQQGFTVTGLRRSVPEHEYFPVLQADLQQPDTLTKLMSAYDFVIYTATPDEITPQGYQAAYVQGVANLQQALAPPKRFLLVSSTGVYHQQQGEWLDENSATEPQRFSGQALLQGEQQALATWANTTVVRFSGIYGAERTRLIRKVSQGCSVREVPPKYTNRIHRDDCVGILAFLVSQQIETGQLDSLYLGTDDEPAAEHEVLDFIAQQLALPLPIRESSSDVSINTPITQNKRCSNQRIKQLGYEFLYPSFREGYGAMLENLRLSSL